MVNLLDLITPEEYELMSYYRSWYARSTEQSFDFQPISIKELLAKPWAEEKQDLYKLLGNSLMVTKEFFYEKDIASLKDEIIDMMSYHSSFGRVEREGWKFADELTTAIIDAYPLPPKYFINDDYFEIDYKTEEDKEIAKKHNRVRYGVEALISCTALAKNVYEGEEFSFTLKNGKEYKVREGCKPMRVLAKLADTYNLLDSFEDFRICHSLIHNQKKLKGYITLSIHPFDYWTMSDNDCDWESCMNWMECGGYRQGTIEMMNSRSVVVAYMHSETPMNLGKGEWNNKKWRQLFIVDKDVILGIKSYPYYNKELTNAVAKWIRELAEQNMGWSYFGNGDEPFDYNREEDYYNPNQPDSLPYQFYFTSNIMYTDVGSAKSHPFYFSTEKIERAFEHDGNMVVEYNYSGASQCVSCGDISPNFYNESFLCCNECERVNYCYNCGEILYDGNGYYMDGHDYCECCYNDLYEECPVCEDMVYIYDMAKINIYIPTTTKNNWYCGVLDNPIRICDSEKCFEEFEKIFLINNSEIEEIKGEYFVSVSNINVEERIWNNYLPYQFLERLEEAQKNNEYNKLADKYDFYIRYKNLI